MNFIGFCVTALIESAAPPLVSPSNLVSTTPSIPKALSKLSATLTALDLSLNRLLKVFHVV